MFAITFNPFFDLFSAEGFFAHVHRPGGAPGFFFIENPPPPGGSRAGPGGPEAGGCT